ncbi:hypothetical protein JOC58_000114 [Paenibacillus hunanensis]|uniref:Uncharacterized protein n=1 Tax=Paenibacillus hunanensis TaxID=539262 RepID=A0ABU1ISK5_9BACL|nr:hypothetical protein [Paenibacillus hunanensis]
MRSSLINVSKVQKDICPGCSPVSFVYNEQD